MVGVGEKVLANLGAEMRQCAALALDGGEDIGAEQAAERGERLGELARLVRDDGLPREEIKEQRVKPGERGVVECGGSLFQNAVEADEDGLFILLRLRAGAVERPLAGVGVEDVRERAEFLPLPLVTVFEFARARAVAGSFQLDETAERFADFNADVGSPAEVVNLRLSLGEHAAGDGGEESLYGAFELILGLRGHPAGEAGTQRVREVTRGSAELRREICGQRHARSFVCGAAAIGKLFVVRLPAPQLGRAGFSRSERKAVTSHCWHSLAIVAPAARTSELMAGRMPPTRWT